VAATALRSPAARGTNRGSAAARPGIYHVCLNEPYIQLTQAMASTAMKMHAPLSAGAPGVAANVEHEESTRLALLLLLLLLL